MNDGATGLMVASQNGHLKVARLLPESGADRDFAMNKGETAVLSKK